MKPFAIWAAALATAIPSLAAAGGPKCLAYARREATAGVPATREQVEQQRLLVEKSKQDLAAIKATYDAAVTAQAALVRQSDAGAQKLANAAEAVRENEQAWADAAAKVECAQKELDEEWRSLSRAELFGLAVDGDVSTAGGAGGVNRFGAGVFMTLRDAAFFDEFQFGLSADSIAEPALSVGAQPTPSVLKRAVAFGLPMRVFYGGFPVAVFLGATPQMLPDRGPQVALSTQLGLRVAGHPPNPGWFFGGIKFFVEPWFPFDGMHPFVLFGAEVGLGIGHGCKNDDDSLKWEFVPRSLH
jgi:hypothetical protein